METSYNATPSDLQQQVHVMILLKAFDILCAKARGRFMLVPLKGIASLVLPTERATDFVALLLQNCYRPEFAFSIGLASLSKKKIPRLSPSYSMCLCAYDSFRSAVHGVIPYGLHRPSPLAL